MATFLNELLADARWYACSIVFSAALIVDFYLLSHPHASGLRVLVTIILTLAMAGGLFLLLRSLKSKTPRDPGDKSGESGSLHFRAAAGKKSK